MASAWERALTTGRGGGSLGSLVRSRASAGTSSPSTPPPGAGRAPQPGLIDGVVPPGSVGSSVVDAAGGGKGGVITRTKFEYPAALPPISPDVAAAFSAQRRVAQRGVEDAEAYRRAGMATAQARKLSAEGELTRQTGRSANTMMQNYASGGRARSPLGVFQERAGIAGDASRQQVVLEEELASTVQELNRMVADAQRAREEAFASIEMQQATLRSNAALQDLLARRQVDMANWQAGF